MPLPFETEITRMNASYLILIGFELDVWNFFFTYVDTVTLKQVTQVAESPSLEVSKTWLTLLVLVEVLF